MAKVIINKARVVEWVDTTDLKSVARKSVRVQVPLRAPSSIKEKLKMKSVKKTNLQVLLNEVFITLKIFKIEWEEKAKNRIELPSKIVLEVDINNNINNQIQDLLFSKYDCLADNYKIQGYSPEANYALQMQLNKS